MVIERTNKNNDIHHTNVPLLITLLKQENLSYNPYLGIYLRQANSSFQVFVNPFFKTHIYTYIHNIELLQFFDPLSPTWLLVLNIHFLILFQEKD